MKKIFSILMAVTLAALSFVSCGEKKTGSSKSAMRIAMVTDSGDITDQSFNQTTYEAVKGFAEANKLDYKYYKPSGDSTEARVSSIVQAIQEDYNVVVLPGFLFADPLVAVVDDNKDVTFIALDVSEWDVMEAAKNAGKTDWKLPENAFCAVYSEEIPGFFAGYAAVKEGYKHLGFLGGMAVPAVIRYGFGFVQGCNKAAEEMGIAKDVTVEYVYGGQFFGDPAITAAMDAWYGQRNVEVVFACGGGIWTSACEAAAKVNAKVIGVDVDQSKLIDKYGEGMCVTSAMKGLAATVNACLKSVQDGKFTAEYGAKISSLGLVSATNPELNFVALPTDSWSMKNFTVDQYNALVKDVFEGKVAVSNDIGAMPKVSVKVNEYPNIK
ncbi:MAG: BMP family ABC transporter substrate-binding protein [Treponema sp.]|uniref:BMP family lipoprotein n=1 Tax=Treponema sp. TaxID=166 RepID=UPI001B79CEAB|nr:BMP family ABC transporter substrate-binding protein [Treponema sp.]MBP5588294.1 BMP family ABC transporter substrate-binding protein [Treponema sp.]MCR5385811.1 BMP family ABC transporter substrate-binding protein [Treponema sp.]